MYMLLKCIFSGSSLAQSFTVPICDKNDINGIEIDFDNLRIGDIKFLIWNKKKEMLKTDDPDDLNLWKIAFDDKQKNITDEQIENKDGLVPIKHLSYYFPNEDAANESLIIVQEPITGKCLPMFYLSNKKFGDID